MNSETGTLGVAESGIRILRNGALGPVFYPTSSVLRTDIYQEMERA
jgi:hypothetical protein